VPTAIGAFALHGARLLRLEHRLARERLALAASSRGDA
jgi:uncharacterized membrane protein